MHRQKHDVLLWPQSQECSAQQWAFDHIEGTSCLLDRHSANFSFAISWFALQINDINRDPNRLSNDLDGPSIARQERAAENIVASNHLIQARLKDVNVQFA